MIQLLHKGSCSPVDAAMIGPCHRLNSRHPPAICWSEGGHQQARPQKVRAKHST